MRNIKVLCEDSIKIFLKMVLDYRHNDVRTFKNVKPSLPLSLLYPHKMHILPLPYPAFLW